MDDYPAKNTGTYTCGVSKYNRYTKMLLEFIQNTIVFYCLISEWYRREKKGQYNVFVSTIEKLKNLYRQIQGILFRKEFEFFVFGNTRGRDIYL